MALLQQLPRLKVTSTSQTNSSSFAVIFRDTPDQTSGKRRIKGKGGISALGKDLLHHCHTAWQYASKGLPYSRQFDCNRQRHLYDHAKNSTVVSWRN